MPVQPPCKGCTNSGRHATAMAYLAEEIHPSGLGKSMGLYVGGTALGGMIGRVGISMLSDLMSRRAAMQWIGAIDIFVAIGFVLLLPPSRNFTHRAELTFREHVTHWYRQISHPALPAIFLIGMFVMGEFVTTYNYAGFRLMQSPFFARCNAGRLDLRSLRFRHLRIFGRRRICRWSRKYCAAYLICVRNLGLIRERGLRQT